jgi:hypothetical protein
VSDTSLAGPYQGQASHVDTHTHKKSQATQQQPHPSKSAHKQSVVGCHIDIARRTANSNSSLRAQRDPAQSQKGAGSRSKGTTKGQHTLDAPAKSSLSTQSMLQSESPPPPPSLSVSKSASDSLSCFFFFLAAGLPFAPAAAPDFPPAPAPFAPAALPLLPAAFGCFALGCLVLLGVLLPFPPAFLLAGFFLTPPVTWRALPVPGFAPGLRFAAAPAFLPACLVPAPASFPSSPAGGVEKAPRCQGITLRSATGP